MKASYAQQKTKRAIAALLAVWLSGVVFLFCCEMPNAQASEAESCPLRKTSHCDKKLIDETASQFDSFETENESINCCRFMSQVFDKARKLETNQQPSDIATTVVVVLPPKFSFLKINSPSFIAYQSAIHNRGSTYLRNRVFRI
jgi:hypothetical protein